VPVDRVRHDVQADWAVAWLGDSEMADRVRAFAWQATPVGALASWPRCLRFAATTCLRSPSQMAVYWGPDLNCIYNDAERDILGDLHPGALGLPARELLRDSWELTGPQLRGVMGRGATTWAEDQPLSVNRTGVLEVGYFTYSYSPVLDDAGAVGGVLLVTRDTTARVIAERRLDTLRDLATHSIDAPTERGACASVARALEGRADIRFVSIYLRGGDGLTRVAGSGDNWLATPRDLDLDRPAPLEAAAARALAQRSPVEVGLVLGVEPDTVRPTFVAPIGDGAGEPPSGLIVLGAGREVVLDEPYRRFLNMVWAGVTRSLAAARQRDAERDRTRAIAALDDAKTALFTNASHELRTPLALILGQLEQLQDEGGSSAWADARITSARRSALRMLKLVNALLDFSRLEAGEHVGAFELTDLPEVTREIAAMFRSAAERAQLRLTVDCPPIAEGTYVDREAWEAIVSNLLSNALKFTLEGEIRVRTGVTDGRFHLTVGDTGIGMTASERRHMFSRFHRGADPRARTHEGSGIGLALVYELVRAHGGTIEARSRRGHGTTMTVRLPLGRAHLDPQRVVATPSRFAVGRAAQMFVAEADGWLDGASAQTAAGTLAAREGPSRSPASAPRRRPHALVVEDNADMRDYLQRLLAPHFSVSAAPDGAVARRVALADPPEVVISDTMMPGLDGFGLIRELREDPRTCHVPVVLVSARADPESTLRALDLGADDYLVKPFGRRELVARVQATVENAALRADAAAEHGRTAERRAREAELRALLNDLRAAQRRVAAAGDAERRRIERNLHDGAQQRLISLRLELGLLQEMIERDPAEARQRLARLRSELDDALEELRELAHGLYPPVLASDGLLAALTAAARRAPIPVTVASAGVRRVTPAIESTAYFCCLEAVQNAAKHAGADARAGIRLTMADGLLSFVIDDDGRGFDVDHVGGGSGLTNLRDRLEALGGHLTVRSEPGRGTTIGAEIPLP